MAGFSNALDFDSPDYSKDSANTDSPDIRSTVYWNPDITSNIKTPAVVSFYTADLPSEYRIVVEGVDAKGMPVRGEKVILHND